MKTKLPKDSDTIGKIYVKCPVENTTGVLGVWLSPLEEVNWSYFYSNGEKKCYGYNITNKRRGISNE